MHNELVAISEMKNYISQTSNEYLHCHFHIQSYNCFLPEISQFQDDHSHMQIELVAISKLENYIF